MDDSKVEKIKHSDKFGESVLMIVPVTRFDVVLKIMLHKDIWDLLFTCCYR